MIDFLIQQLILIISINGQEFQTGELKSVLFVNSINHKLTLPHNAGDYIETSVTFDKPFSEIPELILSMDYISAGPYNDYERGYILKIISINQYGFTTRIIAPSIKQVYSSCFRWIALVDPKVHVIFDQISQPQAFFVRTYSHDDINIKKIVPIICSFVYDSYSSYYFDISFQETDIAKNQVSVTITATKLTDISFQLVLFEENVVWQIGPTPYSPQGNLLDYPFEITNFDIPQNCQQQQVYGIPTIQSLLALGENNLRYQLKSDFITDKLSFTIGSWSDSSFAFGIFDYLIFGCKVFIYPLFLDGFTIYEFSDYTQNNQFSISFPQLQLSYMSSQDYIETDETFIGLKVIISAQCQYIQKFWLFGTIQSNRKYFTDQIYCTPSNNVIQYSLSFNDNNRQDLKRLKIIIQQNSLELIQILSNTKKDQQYQLVKIELNNIYQ